MMFFKHKKAVLFPFLTKSSKPIYSFVKTNLKNIITEQNPFHSFSSVPTTDWGAIMNFSQLDFILKEKSYYSSEAWRQKYLRQDLMQIISRIHCFGESLTVFERSKAMELLDLCTMNIENIIHHREKEEEPELIENFLMKAIEMDFSLGKSMKRTPNLHLNFSVLQLSLKSMSVFRTIMSSLESNQSVYEEHFIEIIKKVSSLGYQQTLRLYFKVKSLRMKVAVNLIADYLRQQELKYEDITNLDDLNFLVDAVLDNKLNDKVDINKIFSILLVTLKKDSNWSLQMQSVKHIMRSLKRISLGIQKKFNIMASLDSLLNDLIIKSPESDAATNFPRILKYFKILIKYEDQKYVSKFEKFTKICVDTYKGNEAINVERAILFLDVFEGDDSLSLKSYITQESFLEHFSNMGEKHLSEFYSSLHKRTKRKIMQFLSECESDIVLGLNVRRKILFYDIMCPAELHEKMNITQELIESLKHADEPLYIIFSNYKMYTKQLQEFLIATIEANFKAYLSEKHSEEEVLSKIHEIVHRNTLYSKKFHVLENTFSSIAKLLLNKDWSHLKSSIIDKIVYLSKYLDSKIEVDKVELFVRENINIIPTKQLASIFYMLATSNQLSEALSLDLQNYFSRIIDSLNAEELSLLYKLTSFIQPRLHFYQPITEIIKFRANIPSYANLVSDFIYHQVKMKKRRKFWLAAYFEGFRKALAKNIYSIDINHYVLAIKALSKFESVNDLMIGLSLRMKIEVNEISENEICFIYTVALTGGVDKESIAILQSRIMHLIKSKRIRNFDIGRMFCQMVTVFENFNKNEDVYKFFEFVRNYIINDSKDRFFYSTHDEDKDQVDIGLFSMVFWGNALLHDRETLKFLENNMRLLERVYLKGKEMKWKDIKSIKNKKFSKSLDSEIKDIAMNQLVGGLIYLLELHENLGTETRKTLKVYLDELRKSDFFSLSKNIEEELENSDSYFEKRVHYLLNLLFPEDNIIYHHPIDIFLVDFLLEKRKIIVECDGRHHYVNGKKKLNDIKKEEIFVKRGYKVISINIEDWNKIPNEKHVEFVKNCILSATQQ